MPTRLTEWTPVADERPAENQHVEVITPGGDQRDLIYANNLWWLPDKSMYCYFTPTFWRPLA
jgi:hypothetical protein